MNGAVQLDLLPPVPPKDIMALIEAKLPKSDWVTVSNVALAGNISVGLVYAWIEEGLIEAVNVGVPGRSYYKIYRPTVIAFYHKRLGGET